jgi:hypothetical protein
MDPTPENFGKILGTVPYIFNLGTSMISSIDILVSPIIEFLRIFESYLMSFLITLNAQIFFSKFALIIYYQYDK